MPASPPILPASSPLLTVHAAERRQLDWAGEGRIGTLARILTQQPSLDRWRLVHGRSEWQI